MKLLIRNTVFTILLILTAGSCNVMKENTPLSRSLYSLNTRYNVHFNGKQSYEEGLKAISQACKDDYSRIIPMYPVSMHENAKAASSQMSRTIEKCRKAIKTKSLKKKPRLTRKQQLNPKYKNYLKQEEYNPFMPEVWLQLAKAEFHKGDFLGAIGTFNYIKKHFPDDNMLNTTCQLWIIRAYIELDWLYEAEEMFGKINQKELTGDNLNDYICFYADLLLRKKQYADAIPFLELALQKEKDKSLKMRFSFLLAQLYAYTGDKKAASQAYDKVIEMSPPYEMSFNAHIGRSSLFLGRMEDTRRDLHKMIRNPNNKEYLDQIFHLIGKTFLFENDTLHALENFKMAVDTSSRKGLDMASVLVSMGDLYYQKKDYVKAQPCYEEASKIYTVDFYDYKRISQRAEMLSELVTEYETVTLQDSLLRLSTMTRDDQLKTIEQYIAKLELEEKLAAEKEKAKNEQQNNENMNGPDEGDSFNPPPPVANNQKGDWYFYNAALIKSGQIEFQKKWGKRKLEDNWRRINKAAVLFAENSPEQASGEIQHPENGESVQQTDSLVAAGAEITDTKNPEYYLRQIPNTPAKIENCHQIRAVALFKTAMIYQDKLEDIPLAISTFNEYHTKYPTYESASDAVYFDYLLHVKSGMNEQAEMLRLKLIKNYPDTKYALLLTNPDYIRVKKQMFTEQDSLYKKAYDAFNENKFIQVGNLSDSMSVKYPLSPLIPRFRFLKALSVGKTGSQDAFEKELQEIITNFPESEVTSISKEMLAMVKQGMQTREGTTQGSILALRE